MVEDRAESKDLREANPERFERMKAALIAYDNDVLIGGHDGWQQGSWKRSFPPEVVEELEKEPSK
jgi:hypothetical protein